MSVWNLVWTTVNIYVYMCLYIKPSSLEECMGPSYRIYEGRKMGKGECTRVWNQEQSDSCVDPKWLTGKSGGPKKKMR